MPQAREKAREASLPTLVDLGREFLRMRRIQARGGSNSLVPPVAGCWLLEEEAFSEVAVEDCAAGVMVADVDLIDTLDHLLRDVIRREYGTVTHRVET